MDEYVYQQPYQAPAPAPRFPLKPILGVLGAVIVIGGGIWIWRLRGASTRQLLVDRQQTVQDEIAKIDDVCANVSDPASCQKSLLDSVAQAMNSPEACQALKDPVLLDDCIWGVAASAMDLKICSQMADKALAAACVDGIALTKAVAAADEKLCAAIKDESKQANCLESITPTTSANCAAREKSAEECAARAAIETAQTKRDPALCVGVSVEFQPLCYELVIADTDLDGLVDADESLYKSDPRKADTDGDGFKDGDEVQKGFNPAGPGKLVTAGS